MNAMPLSTEKIHVSPFWVSFSDLSNGYHFHETVLAILSRGHEFLEFIKNHEMYSLLYLRRRADNTRGSPVRAALLWSMLEEARIYTEDHFNMNQRVVTRPIRDLVAAITGRIQDLDCFKPSGLSRKV